MRIGYLDVFCGLSGDMFLGALVDAGMDLQALVNELHKLPLEGWEVTAREVRKSGLRATKVDVAEAHGHHHHHHHHDEHQHGGMSADEIIEIIRGGSLREDLVERAVAVVERIAEAEAQAHGVPREQVHFHELGGLDTVIDVCGAVIGLDLLGIERLYCSPLPMAHGYVDTAHGRLPVPPPAVARLVEGVPTYPLDIEGENITPTGAALAVALADFSERPPMKITATGLGAGTKDFPIPNMVRLFVGDQVEASSDGPGVPEGPNSRGLKRLSGPLTAGPDTDDTAVSMRPLQAADAAAQMVLLEANLDDMSGEFFGYALEKVFAAGAADVWMTPIVMKKNRPAVMLSALAAAGQADAVAEAILMHTTSFGLRRQVVGRDCLEREHVTVSTPYGEVRVKVGKRGGRVLTAAPEYEDCAAAAQRAGLPLKRIYQAALAAYENLAQS